MLTLVTLDNFFSEVYVFKKKDLRKMTDKFFQNFKSSDKSLKMATFENFNVHTFTTSSQTIHKHENTK